MKKVLIVCSLAVATITNSLAQSKEAMFERLHSPAFAWFTGQMIDNFTMLNMSEDSWKYALTDENNGILTLNTLGNNIGNYFDLIHNNRLSSDCRYGQENAECKDKINALKGQLSIVFNATNIGSNPAQVKLAMRALNLVGKFFDNGTYGPKVGWRPKTNTLKIILNAENSKGQPTVTWSSDGSTATVRMPVGTESSYWDENILKGLEKGGVKK